MQQIGVELMRAHANAVRTLGNPTAGDIADYHSAVFAMHGLPPSTFGGSQITGEQKEAGLTSGAWMECK